MLSHKTIEIVQQHPEKLTNASFIEIAINLFCEEFLTEQDKSLLSLAFSENPDQEDLDAFLANWDIEAAGGHKAIMMSYFMKMHPDLKFTNYEFPRLKGLLRFHRFANLKLMAHYTKLGKALNKEKIPLMILKGGAMKYLRPDLPRVMADIDILVPSEYFLATAQIAQGLGYLFDESEKAPEHSIDLFEPGSTAGTIDIHKYLLMPLDKGPLYNECLFSRAMKAKIFGVDSLIPCNEDLVFIALTNLSRNLMDHSSVKGILFNLFDCKYLIESKEDFDWNIVIENARLTSSVVQLHFAITFLNKIIPNILPSHVINNKEFAKEIEEYSEDLLFNSIYFRNLQIYARTLRIKDIFKSFAHFKEYIRVKPRYALIKRLKHHKAVVHYILEQEKKGKGIKNAPK